MGYEGDESSETSGEEGGDAGWSEDSDSSAYPEEAELLPNISGIDRPGQESGEPGYETDGAYSGEAEGESGYETDGSYGSDSETESTWSDGTESSGYPEEAELRPNISGIDRRGGQDSAAWPAQESGEEGYETDGTQ